MGNLQLMLGDWVQGFSENTFAEILEISHCGRVTISTQDGQTITLNSKDIQPISLTKIILRKNGFKPYENVPNIYERVDACEDGRIFLRIEIRLDRRTIDLFASFSNPNGRYPINRNAKIEGCGIYVHELQQAMRLVGLTEIADNFKV